MKNLIPPPIDSIDFLHKAGKGLHEKVRDKDRNLVDNIKKIAYDSNKTLLEKAYLQYDSMTTPMALEKLQPIWKVNDGDSLSLETQKRIYREGIHDLYGRERKFISDLWDLISKNSNRETIMCPICGSEAVYELDHYVPREVMPEYSVHVRNLIPLCHRCNHLKLDEWLNDMGLRKIFNAYYDSVPNESLLQAKISQGSSETLPSIIVSLRKDIDLSIDSNRLFVSTFEQIQLQDVFQREGRKFFKDKCIYLRNQFRNKCKRHPNDEMKTIWDEIKEDIEDTILDETEELNKLIYKAICDSPVFESWIKGKC